MKKRIALILLAAMLLSSCGGTAAPTETEPAENTETAADIQETEAAGYDYAAHDFGGYTFHIINMDTIYSMHTRITVDELNGDALNDAMYNRQLTVEEGLNVRVEELVTPADNYFSELLTTVQNTVSAGDSTYDMAYIPPSMGASVLTGGYMANILDVKAIDLENEWYNQAYNAEMAAYGVLPMGMSAASIMLYDSFWMLFFNEDMMTDRNLEFPYDLVREGNWTMDKFHEYCLAAASANGDESFAWSQNGSATYGVTMQNQAAYRFLCSMNESIVRNKDGEIVMTAGSESFYNALDTASRLLSFDDGAAYVGGNDDMNAEKGGYMYPFSVERAMFLTAEVCKSQGFRDFDFNYGIVPFPKYDAQQENYITCAYQNAFAFGFLTSGSDIERAAVVLDAMSYEGWQTVVPTYLHVTVEHKGLRNEDSVEMLEFVLSNTYMDIGQAFGFGTELMNGLMNEIIDKKGAAASLVAAQTSAIESGIAALKDSWNS